MLLGMESGKQLHREKRRIFHEKIRPLDAFQDSLDHIVLHACGEIVDILVMKVKGRFADLRQFRQFFYRDPFQRFVRPQFQKGIANAFLCFLLSQIHIILLYDFKNMSISLQSGKIVNSFPKQKLL